MYLATSVGMDKVMFFVYVTLYAGMAIPLFTLNLAYVNDYISKEKFVAAGGGMQIIFGIGSNDWSFSLLVDNEQIWN